MSSNNLIEKSSEIKKLRSNVRTISTINSERKNSILTLNISKKLHPIKDLKFINKENSQRIISSKVSKNNNFNQKSSYSNIKKDSMIKNDSNQIVYKNFESNHNNFAVNPPESERKPIESKPILRIRNLLEVTKMNALKNNKAISDRFYQPEQLINTFKKHK